MNGKALAIIKWWVFFAGVCLLVLTCGCSKSTKKSLWDQLKQLEQEKTTLKLEVERLKSENEDLTGQVENLSVLGPEARLEALPLLKSITLGRRTGLFDKDKNGTKEKLIVDVRPLDETGDPIKAPGKMQVQLWDLNRAAYMKAAARSISSSRRRKAEIPSSAPPRLAPFLKRRNNMHRRKSASSFGRNIPPR